MRFHQCSPSLQTAHTGWAAAMKLAAPAVWLLTPVAVWGERRAVTASIMIHSGGFLSILRCLRQLGNLSLLPALTLEVTPSIFSFFTSNKCVRHSVSERLAIRDPCLLSWTVPTVSHLSCLVYSQHLGYSVTLWLGWASVREWRFAVSDSISLHLLLKHENRLCR